MPPRVRPAHFKSFCSQIILTGMGITFLEGLVDNRGATRHAATTPDSSHYTKGAPGTNTSRRGAAFQPRCREQGRVGMIAAEVQGFLECVP